MAATESGHYRRVPKAASLPRKPDGNRGVFRYLWRLHVYEAQGVRGTREMLDAGGTMGRSAGEIGFAGGWIGEALAEY